MEEPKTNENLIQYRLTQIEKKVDASDVKAAQEFNKLNDKLDKNIEGLITRKEYEADEHTRKEELKLYVLKSEFEPTKSKANTVMKIMVFIGMTAGGVLVVAATYFALSGALSQ